MNNSSDFATAAFHIIYLNSFPSLENGIVSNLAFVKVKIQPKVKMSINQFCGKFQINEKILTKQ